MAEEPATELVARMFENGTATVTVRADGQETYVWQGTVADFAAVAQQGVSSQVETYASQGQGQGQEEGQQADEEQHNQDISPPAATPE